MIQLYAKTKDLKLTEPNPLPIPKYGFNDPDEEILLENDMDCYKAFEKDILENGFKYCLVVNPETGAILDGNCRLRVAIKNNIEFVPINVEHFMGIDRSYYPKKKVKPISLEELANFKIWKEVKD